ncbi:MAG: PqqD family protein, partial [Actinobacteria bacterium]|nr:PqqD family protein [Actinomycetota bacterium]
RGGSGEWITVDAVGALIWPLLDGHRTAESIGRELGAAFSAPRVEIEADISRWIGELLERGFLLQP